VGQEHGRTIALADTAGGYLTVPALGRDRLPDDGTMYRRLMTHQ